MKLDLSDPPHPLFPSDLWSSSATVIMLQPKLERPGDAVGNPAPKWCSAFVISPAFLQCCEGGIKIPKQSVLFFIFVWGEECILVCWC